MQPHAFNTFDLIHGTEWTLHPLTLVLITVQELSLAFGALEL